MVHEQIYLWESSTLKVYEVICLFFWFYVGVSFCMFVVLLFVYFFCVRWSTLTIRHLGFICVLVGCATNSLRVCSLKVRQTIYESRLRSFLVDVFIYFACFFSNIVSLSCFVSLSRSPLCCLALLSIESISNPFDCWILLILINVNVKYNLFVCATVYFNQMRIISIQLKSRRFAMILMKQFGDTFFRYSFTGKL